jgi:hypothetical protein
VLKRSRLQPGASASSLLTTTQVRPHRLSHPLPHAQATSPVLPHHRERHVPHSDERHVPHRDRHDHELRRERRAAPLLRLLSVLALVPVLVLVQVLVLAPELRDVERLVPELPPAEPPPPPPPQRARRALYVQPKPLLPPSLHKKQVRAR